MIATLAPLFDRAPLSILTAAYRAWAGHYNACAACQGDDWYDPAEGEANFCEAGRRLFAAWVRSARMSNPSSVTWDPNTTKRGENMRSAHGH